MLSDAESEYSNEHEISEEEEEEEEIVGNKTKHEAFMDALSKVLSTKTADKVLNKKYAYKWQNIILSKAKSIEKKLDEEESLEKARRMMTREQKAKLRQDHVQPSFYHPETEKKLKNIATRGGK